VPPVTEPRRTFPSRHPAAADDPSTAPVGAAVCAPGERVRLTAPPFADRPGGVQWEQSAGPEAAPDADDEPEPVVLVPVALVNTRLAYVARPAGEDGPEHVVTLWVGPDPSSPAAEAGRTQVVPEGEVVLLDGRGTRLPPGTSAREVGWEWVQVAGPPVALSDRWSLTPAFRAPEGLVSSDVRLELRLTQGSDDGVCSVATVDIVVHGPAESLALASTTPPTAAAGDLVTLSAAAEVEPGRALRWCWRQVAGPPVALDDEYAARPKLHVPVCWRNVELAFEATAVEDGRCGTAHVAVCIEPDADALAVSVGPDRTVSDGDLVELAPTLRYGTAERCNVHWRQLAGPPVHLRSACRSGTSFLAPDVARTRVQLACVATSATSVSIATVCVTVVGDEEAPQVDAGSSLAVEPGASVELVGRAHTADDSDVRVLWRQLRGPRVTLAEPSSISTRFLAPDTREDGEILSTTLVFALHAFHRGLESVATVAVRVGEPDATLAAPAGADREALPGEEVFLGRWDEGQIERVERCVWRQVAGPPVDLEDARSPEAWFRTPGGYANTRLTFELDAVLDGRRIVDTVDVVVDPDEDAPVARVAADRSASPRELVRLAAFTRDPEGLAPQVRWRQVAGPQVVLDDDTSLQPTFPAPVVAQPDTLVFQFVVSDGVATVVESTRVALAAVALDDVPSLVRSLPGPRRLAG